MQVPAGGRGRVWAREAAAGGDRASGWWGGHQNFQKSTLEHNLRAERCELCWSGKGLYCANGIGRKALLEMVGFERVLQGSEGQYPAVAASLKLD